MILKSVCGSANDKMGSVRIVYPYRNDYNGILAHGNRSVACVYTLYANDVHIVNAPSEATVSFYRVDRNSGKLWIEINFDCCLIEYYVLRTKLNAECCYLLNSRCQQICLFNAC